MEAIKETANLLREGATADIWYDADRFYDAAKVRQIEATQDAMQDAATMLAKLPVMLAALRQIVEESDNVLLFSPPSKTNAARTIAAKARRIALEAIAKAEA